MSKQRNNCLECGNKHDNYNLLCDACAPAYQCNDCPACRSKTAVNYPCKKDVGDDHD